MRGSTVYAMSRLVTANGPKGLYGRFISPAAVICRMNALDGFGFTRALIFPYDELDFLPLRSLGGNAHA